MFKSPAEVLGVIDKPLGDLFANDYTPTPTERSVLLASANRPLATLVCAGLALAGAHFLATHTGREITTSSTEFTLFPGYELAGASEHSVAIDQPPDSETSVRGQIVVYTGSTFLGAALGEAAIDFAIVANLRRQGIVK